MSEAVAVIPEIVPIPLRLDLGCGLKKKEGFIGVDVLAFDGKVDVVCDLRQTWRWVDDSVDEVHCSHFLEHLTGAERVHFANELYRVLKKTEYGPDGKPNKGFAFIVVPSWNNERAYGDPTHQWPPVVGFAFFYWNKVWRDGNAPHTGFTCDFDFGGGNAVVPPWNLRTQEVQIFAQTHYTNVAMDMYVTLTKK
jgi:hypothetical protein